ncbi:serine hydrolase domain-containing protein [Actinomadura sp. KC345]|uniref:serine hydrolase domain-containing protein n=1 Tax=Actinomadura sp. KC345 TaxID=2530371 RepID=UPI001A9D0303|nr:serine hydrolase domain-containing protein [Actinomadura sp. KC345]
MPDRAGATGRAATGRRLRRSRVGSSPSSPEDLYDWEKSVSRPAGQAPWWEPGTASGYHAFNQGHLLGELVRRVSGKALQRFVADEIAEPLGADLRIGAGAEDDHRVAEIVPPPPLPLDLDSLPADSPAVRTMTGPAVDPAVANTLAWRRADMGAVNGHTTATPRPHQRARWRARCRSSPAVARSTGCGCSRRRRSTTSSTSRPAGRTGGLHSRDPPRNCRLRLRLPGAGPASSRSPGKRPARVASAACVGAWRRAPRPHRAVQVVERADSLAAAACSAGRAAGGAYPGWRG